ncbi:DUF4085 domain-containing protein [Halobacillus litoralis]|uniref:DUF4085 family protein n=1 Tax=Halobacillus litoralis TaxID=45668 RepID=UPI001CD75892|nr:DUF4085 family protein [Halobacillus litoralis]MCA0970702.1 DUF4085 domain-containing protein [Halobacillus litoralis]
MWNISQQAKDDFLIKVMLPIPESSEEWEELLEEDDDALNSLRDELKEGKPLLKQTLPERFHPYLEEGSLVEPSLPDSVREDYLSFQRDAENEFNEVLQAAEEQTEKALPFLSEKARDVFSDSLHDAVIEEVNYETDALHMVLNMESGFSEKNTITLSFLGIQSQQAAQPLQVGQWLLYHELQKTEDGFAFRGLFDCPEVEWTVTIKGLEASYT